MRARGIAIVAFAVALGASFVACVDLFHGTDFESACGVDAAACEAIDATPAIDTTPPPEDSGPTGPTNFCLEWDAGTALTNATHACAWLSACEGALGDNAFGACMVRAVLAYDCTANPNRPLTATGPAHAYWDCLWQVKSCGDVDRCIEPSGTLATCAADTDDAGYVACDLEAGTLVACGPAATNGNPPTALESCTAIGQTCAASGAAACLGSATACAGQADYCDPDGVHLHDCDPDGGTTDYGVDCASFGGGICNAGGCTAVGGSACSPTSDVTCDGGVATGCPSGSTEQVDCDAVLAQPSGGPATCNATAPGRPWDVARACSVGTCPLDRCDGATLMTCARGGSIAVSCTAQGFTGCSPSPYPHCSSD
jgi:hypothetical protein